MEQLPNGKKLIEVETDKVYFVRDFRKPKVGELVLCIDCIEMGWVEKPREYDKCPTIHVDTVYDDYHKGEWNILRQGKN